MSILYKKSKSYQKGKKLHVPLKKNVYNPNQSFNAGSLRDPKLLKK